MRPIYIRHNRPWSIELRERRWMRFQWAVLEAATLCAVLALTFGLWRIVTATLL